MSMFTLAVSSDHFQFTLIHGLKVPVKCRSAYTSLVLSSSFLFWNRFQNQRKSEPFCCCCLVTKLCPALCNQSHLQIVGKKNEEIKNRIWYLSLQLKITEGWSGFGMLVIKTKRNVWRGHAYWSKYFKLMEKKVSDKIDEIYEWITNSYVLN